MKMGLLVLLKLTSAVIVAFLIIIAGLGLGYLTIAHSALDPGDALEKGEEYAFKWLNYEPHPGFVAWAAFCIASW